MDERELADFGPDGHLLATCAPTFDGYTCHGNGKPMPEFRDCASILYAIAQDAEQLIAGMTSTPPERPTLPLPTSADGPFVDGQGREWSRLVFSPAGPVVAAETPDGVVWVWDSLELFSAVFRAAEGAHRG